MTEQNVKFFLVGVTVGILTLGTIIVLTDDAISQYAYDKGVKDALSGRLSPVIHVEDGDTTITYKMQQP